MAPVEIYTYRHLRDSWEKTGSVAPGSRKNIDDLRPAKLLVFCNQQDQHGVFQVKGDSEHIEVRLYRNENDDGVIIADTQRALKFLDEQTIIAISNSNGKALSVRHFRAKDQDQQEVSQKGTLEKTSDPASTTKLPF